MNRPDFPLRQHFRTPLRKKSEGHYVASVKWLRLDWRVEVTPNLMIRVCEGRVLDNDPFALVAPLSKFDWGYGAVAEMAGFPYVLAMLLTTDGWCAELWSEAAGLRVTTPEP